MLCSLRLHGHNRGVTGIELNQNVIKIRCRSKINEEKIETNIKKLSNRYKH